MNVRVGTPSIEEDFETSPMQPQQCRFRGIVALFTHTPLSLILLQLSFVLTYLPALKFGNRHHLCRAAVYWCALLNAQEWQAKREHGGSHRPCTHHAAQRCVLPHQQVSWTTGEDGRMSLRSWFVSSYSFPFLLLFSSAVSSPSNHYNNLQEDISSSRVWKRWYWCKSSCLKIESSLRRTRRGFCAPLWQGTSLWSLWCVMCVACMV